jgi:hypothetical protein
VSDFLSAQLLPQALIAAQQFGDQLPQPAILLGHRLAALPCPL